jgi:hypothetical protein
MTTLTTDLSPERRQERDVELGPFFLSGAILLVYGLKRRRKLAVAAGLVSIWLDQRSKLGRGLKKRIKARSEQLAGTDGDQAGLP